VRYKIVVKRHGNGFGAEVPDLPGVIAIAPTEPEVRTMIREAIKFRLATGAQLNSLIEVPRRVLEN
jgi:predicted RNase H-like HicB family nuclease